MISGVGLIRMGRPKKTTTATVRVPAVPDGSIPTSRRTIISKKSSVSTAPKYVRQLSNTSPGRMRRP